MGKLEPSVIANLSTSLEIDLRGEMSIEELEIALANYINYLLTHDFHKLMHILYRVDVSEKMLKANLQEGDTDAGTIMARMILERQLKKIATRNESNTGDEIPESEKW